MRRIWVGLLLAAALMAETSVQCSSKEARAFDFWVGTWDVVGTGGQKLGENRIERLLGGCVLMENWRDAKGREGKSWNYWHAPSKTWKQNWVDAGGRVTEYVGTPTAMGIRFEADSNGVVNVMAFTRRDDGTVEQKIEISRDGRKTWTAGFLGIYRRR